jgi:hypothetical protein
MKNEAERRPILVAGAHRTGTTWVGKMLVASGEAAYISEPLNVWHRPGVLRVPIEHWYTYICDQNEAGFLAAFGETLRFHYHPWAELKSLRSRKDVLRMGRDWSIFWKGWLLRQRPLFKDPFAIFSAPWFADRLGFQVVITVRHPAAFVSSLKRLDWSFEFADLLKQPLLMRDWLEPFRDEMESMSQTPNDVVGQAALLWRMIYQVVSGLRDRYPQFQVVRHEDLSIDPLKGFGALYNCLGLDFTPQAQQAVLKSSSSENPQEISKKAVHNYRLDSQANLNNWKRRLDPQEIARIRALTEEAADQYYRDLGWE